MPDNRHRAILHNSFGIDLLIQVFGPTIVNSNGRHIPTRWIGEQHVREDIAGPIPTLADWLRCMKLEPWMERGARKLSREVEL